MKKNLLRKTFTLSGIGTVLLVPFFAHAQSLAATSIAQAGLLYFLNYITSALFSFAAFFVNVALELNSLAPTFPIVQIGWTVVLNLTNLAFVMGIIVIAIATILRIERYGMKQILWKFIVAAVLVNFSLVIATVFLDLAGILTDFFVNKAIPGGDQGTISDFVNQLSASIGPQTSIALDAEKDQGWLEWVATGLTSNFGGLLRFNFNLVFSMLFLVIGMITMFGIAIMFLVRFFYIVVLLIFAPIVWLGWVFPYFSKYWSDWWSSFLKWTFFAPACTFFLYLAIRVGLDRQNTIENLASAIGQVPGGPIEAVEQTLISNASAIIHGLVVCGLMVVSLIVGEKFSVKFASGFKNAAYGVGRWTLDSAKKGSARLATAPLRGEAARNTLDRWSKGEGLAKVPVVGRFAASALSRPIANMQQQVVREVESAKDKVKGFDSSALALRYATSIGASRAAILETLAERGDLNKVPADQIDHALMRRFGREGKLAAANPLLNRKVTDALTEWRSAAGEAKGTALARVNNELGSVLRSMKPEQWSKMHMPSLLEGAGIGKDEWGQLSPLVGQALGTNLNSNNLKKLADTLSPTEIEKIQNFVKTSFATQHGGDERGMEVLKEKNEWLHRFLTEGISQDLLSSQKKTKGMEKPLIVTEEEYRREQEQAKKKPTIIT